MRGYNLYIWVALTLCSSKEQLFLPFLGRRPLASALLNLRVLCKTCCSSTSFSGPIRFCFAEKSRKKLTQGPSLSVSAAKQPWVGYKEAFSGVGFNLTILRAPQSPSVKGSRHGPGVTCWWQVIQWGSAGAFVSPPRGNASLQAHQQPPDNRLPSGSPRVSFLATRNQIQSGVTFFLKA